MTQNTEVRNNIVFRLDYIDYYPISQHDLRHYIISGLCSFPGVSHILSQRKLIRSTRCLPSERILCKQIYKVSRLTQRRIHSASHTNPHTSNSSSHPIKSWNYCRRPSDASPADMCSVHALSKIFWDSPIFLPICSCQSYSYFTHMNSCYSRHSLWHRQILLQEIKNTISVVHPLCIHGPPPIRLGSMSRFSKVFISGLLKQRLHFKRKFA